MQMFMGCKVIITSMGAVREQSLVLPRRPEMDIEYRFRSTSARHSGSQ